MIKYFKQSSGLASIYIVFEGSNLEQEHELGASHLLEHLVCHNLRRYEDQFELHGVDSNAGTCPSFTQYYIRGLDEKVKKFAQVFYDAIALTPLRINETAFEEEKRIIIQEWHDDVSNPETNLSNRFFLKYYNSPRTIGSITALEKLTFKEFKEMYQRHYSKPLFCLVEQSSPWKIKDNALYKESHDSVFEFNKTTEKNIFPVDQGSNPHFLIISDNFQDNITNHYLINSMIGEGLNSPLLKALREKHQLVYALSSTFEVVNPCLFHSKFLTSSQKKNKDQIWKVFKEVLVAQDWLTEQRFKQSVNRFKIEVEIEKRLNLYSETQQFLNPYEKIIEDEMMTVKFSQVKKLAKDWYQPERFLFFY